VRETIRVLLCDDQAIIRVRVREALAQSPDIEVIGEAAGGLVGVAMAIGLGPDVVLMDVSMPDLNGIEATRRILDAAPRIRVLGFSAEAGRGTVEAMISAGARGYLLKHTDPEEMIRTIRLVMKNGSLKGAVGAVAGGMGGIGQGGGPK
jgi:two-component system, NarL family, response regulator NreC